MKNYYLKNGEKVTGPYMLDDLKYQRISVNTLVSIDHGPWQVITSLDDLKPILEFAGINTTSSNSHQANKQFNTAPSHPTNKPAAGNKKIAMVIAIAVLMLGLGMAFFLLTELK